MYVCKECGSDDLVAISGLGTCDYNNDIEYLLQDEGVIIECYECCDCGNLGIDIEDIAVKVEMEEEN